MEFKDRIKELRKESYLSQEALAAQLFVSRSLVARWEAGLCLPTDESLDKIAKLFKVEKETLINKEVTSLDLVKKNITINKISNKLKFSLAAIILLSVLLIVTLVFYITNRLKYVDIAPTITKIEFIPVDVYSKVDDLDYDIDYSSVPSSYTGHNEMMTNLIDKSLNEFDLSVNEDGAFVSAHSRQQVKIYFDNPYNVKFANVDLSADTTGLYLEEEEIIIIDNYIFIDDFYIYDGDLLELELSISYVEEDYKTTDDGIRTRVLGDCKYLFDKKFEVYVGDIYTNAQISEINVINKTASFNIFSQIEKGSYGKLIVYNSFNQKVDEHIFDNSGEFIKNHQYSCLLNESHENYYYVLLIIGNGHDLKKPQVIVADYGMFNAFDNYHSDGHSILDVKADFATDNAIYLRIDNYTENIIVDKVLVYRGKRLETKITDFIDINGEKYAVFENYQKNIEYTYYLLFTTYGEYSEQNVNLYKGSKGTEGIYDDKVAIENIEILNPQEIYHLGDVIRVKFSFESLPDRLFCSYKPLNYFNTYAIEEEDFADKTITVVFKLDTIGINKIGLKWLYYYKEANDNIVLPMHFTTLEYIEVEVVE